MPSNKKSWSANLLDLFPGRVLFRSQLWISITTFVIFLCLFIARAAQPYQPESYLPDWGDARWIAPKSGSAVAYYRTDFKLEALPKHALLQIAAPDSFDIYVNGQSIGSSSFTSVTTFDLFDIGAYLRPGHNIVAVRVSRSTYPGTASLLASLQWQDAAGNRGIVKTNTNWRVTNRRDSQQSGAIQWYDPDLDDSVWPQANELSNTVTDIHATHSWATLTLLETFPRGEWIRSPKPLARNVTVHRDFDLPSENIKHAWLGIASNAEYTLIVNTTRISINSPTYEFMDVYDIGPYLTTGKNSIEIDASHSSTNAQLAVGSMIYTSNSVIDISSGDQWLIQIDEQSKAWEPVTRVGGIDSIPITPSNSSTEMTFHTPVLRLMEAVPPGGYILRHVIQISPLMIAVMFGILVVTAKLMPRQDDASSIQILDSLSLPYFAGSLLFLVTFLLSFDVRINDSQIFCWPVAVVVALLAIGWSVLMLLEARHARN